MEDDDEPYADAVGTAYLWGGFRGALAKVDPAEIRAALRRQDSLASLDGDGQRAVEAVVDSLAAKLCVHPKP